MIKELLMYLFSRLASFIFVRLLPLEVTGTTTGNIYTIQATVHGVLYYVSVMQHRVMVSTEIYGFDKQNTFYTAEVLTVLDNSTTKTVFDYLPQPTRSLFNCTKLPHALVARIIINYIANLPEGVCLGERESLYKNIS